METIFERSFHHVAAGPFEMVCHEYFPLVLVSLWASSCCFRSPASPAVLLLPGVHPAAAQKLLDARVAAITVHTTTSSRFSLKTAEGQT